MMNFVEIRNLVVEVLDKKLHGATLKDRTLQSRTICDTDRYEWTLKFDRKNYKINVDHNKELKEVEIWVWNNFDLIVRYTKQYI